MYTNASLTALAVCCVLSCYSVPKRQSVGLSFIAQMFVVITSLYEQTDCRLAEGLIEVTTDNDCTCPGDTLTYECTVDGDNGGFTLWMGDFFNCSHPSNEKVIDLGHSQFVEEGAETKVCNDGDVMGRMVRSENGSFISHLNITLTSAVVGKEIKCAYDNGTIHRVGSHCITKDLVSTHSHPENIRFTSFCPNMHFKWDVFSPNCSAVHVHYEILASSCGSCPNITNYTNVTCTLSTDESKFDDRNCLIFVRSAFSLKSSTCYSEWQSESLKISRCPGENDFKDLLLALIPPLAMMLLLLLVLVPLSLHYIIKRRSLLVLRKSSQMCQTIHRNNQQKEQETGKHGGESLAEECTIETSLKIFINGVYNLEEPDVTESEVQESMRGGSIPLTLNNLLIKLDGCVSSHWYKFGLAIGISEDVLEKVVDYSDKDALVEILDYWLKHHPSGQPTWKDVTTALKHTGFNDVVVE